MALKEVTIDSRLSDVEYKKLRVAMDQLMATISAYPSETFKMQRGKARWAKREKWAREALGPAYIILSQLARVQGRSNDLRNACFNALTAYDRLLGIVENRYQQQVLEHYATAKLTMQTCDEHLRRILPNPL